MGRCVASAGDELGRFVVGYATRMASEQTVLEVSNARGCMGQKLTMVYWKGDQFWLGKLLEHPEIMTQGDTIEELEENLKEAFRLMALPRGLTCWTHCVA